MHVFLILPPYLPSDVSIAFAFFYITLSMGRCVDSVWNFRVEMVYEFQRNVPVKRVVSRRLCSGDVAGNKLSWDAPPRIFPATSPWYLPSFILLHPWDVASIQCEIFVLKWYANFNATSPGKELYHGGYARETLLGILDCGYVESMRYSIPTNQLILIRLF